MRTIASLLLVLGLASGPTLAMATDPKDSPKPEAPDRTLDAAARDEVIDGALQALNESYIFPEVAEQMEAAIRASRERKEYDSITSARQLAQRLTRHLRAVSHDRHLAVIFSPKALPRQQPLPPPDSLAEAGRQNFGFVRVERLAGNIGYLDLRAFLPAALAGETAAAAMTFLASCDAVILDLRQNVGGHPEMVALLTSYLFGPEPVHLNDFYIRSRNETHPSWTLPYVPGRRLPHADVYLLTSPRTISGGEEFAYNLKHLKRATVVGETTGGGAHTIDEQRINDHFMVYVPWGRPINAVTKTDWEGVGVEPDVKVAAESALDTAHLLALEKQAKTLPAGDPGLGAEVTAAIQSLRTKRLPAARNAVADPEVTVAKAALERLAGSYENKEMDLVFKVDLQGDRLHLSVLEGPRFPPALLIPTSPTRFQCEGEGLAPGLSVIFQVTGGKPTALTLVQPDMPEVVLKRSE